MMNNSDFIDRFWEIVRNIFVTLAKTVVHFSDATEKAELSADPQTLLLIAGGLLLLFGSGCWAASLAGARRHSPWLHFFIGLLLPVLYPLVLLFAMDLKGNRGMRKALRAMEEAERKAEQEKRNADDSAVPSEKTSVENVGPEGWNQAYFASIARKPDGSYAGPWKMSYNTRTVVVEKILEPLPEILVFEAKDDKGTVSRFRVPYAKIEVWESLSQE